MSNQILISSGAKLRDLDDVIIGTDGVLSSLGFDVPYGVPRLDANGKILVSELPNSVMEFKGVWNAATNTPTLTNGVGNAGDVYLCNVAGTVNFGAGPITFAVGDYAVYTGSVWARSSGAVGTVTSVAVSRDGDALAITGSPITSSGTINIGFTGTSAQYINGAGNLTTFPTIISEAQNLVTEVYNETGATLTKGTIVYINGGHGNLPTVTKAIATSDATSAQTYGVVRSDITTNNNGYVTVIGSLGDLDTQAYPAGTQLYLSGTTAGAWTSTKPQAPVHLVYVGIVVRSHPTQGVVEVRIQNGYELSEIHDVQIISPTNGNILQYDSATSLWKNVAGTTTNIAEGTNLYFTNARARNAISLTTTGSTGAATYDSATGILNIPNYVDQYVGTVTSVGLSAPTGFSVSGSPVTSSGTLALSFASGYSLPTTLKQSNWDDAYTWVAAFPTQTGNAGKFLTTDGSTLSWATVIAGVQSVTASSPLSSSGGSTPNITISQATTSTNGYLSSTDWNTFNSKQAGSTNLTSLSGLTFASTSFVKMTSAGTFALDTNTYALASSLSGYLPLTGGTLSGLLTINSNLKQNGKIYNTIDWLKEVAFGYAGWSTIMFGTASSVNFSLAFNVDLSGNPSSSFTGNGSEYFWRNAGSFKSPNAANNGYNTIMTWDSSGNVVFNYIGGTWNGAAIGDGFISSAATWNAKQNAITLTTTGSSGAATFIGSTLNIPNYGSALSGYVTLDTTQTISGTKTFSSYINATSSAVFNGTGRATDYQYADMTNTGGRLIIGVDRSTGGAIVPGLSGSNTSLAYASSFGTSTATWVHLFTSDQIRLNISPTGNVSIGNTNNTYKFDVTGTTIFRGASIIEIGSVSTIGLLSESALDLSGGGYGSNVLQITYGYHSGSYAPVSSGMIVTNPSGATKGDYFIALRDVITAGTAPTIQFRVASNGNVSMGANAGISRNLNIEGSDTWISLKRTGGREYMIGTGLEDNFRIYDNTAGTDRFKIDSTGVSTFYRNVNISSTYSYNVNGFPALRYSYWGYSSSYPVIVLGNASGNSGISINYDPVINPNGAFTGDGKEVLFRNGVRFATPNDANTSFYLNTMIFQNGSVIIGANATVTGAGALQVNGNVNITGVFQINGVTIGGGGGSGVTGTGTTNYHTKWSSSTSVTNSILYDDGTRIGLNTTSAVTATRFQIDLSGSGTYGIFINKTTADEATMRFKSTHDANSDYRIGASILIGSAFEIYNVNAAATRFAVLADGNTLIGGTSSVTGAGQLQVRGDVNITGNFKINGSALSSGIGGSGTTSYIPRFSSGTILGNSTIQDNGTIATLTAGANVSTYQNIVWKGTTSASDFSMGNGGAGMYILSSASIDLNAPIVQRNGLGYSFAGTSSSYNVLLLNSGTSIDEITILGGVRLNTTTAGMIFPRMTTTQLNALSARGSTYCPNGTTVFDITINILRTWNGSAWMNLW